METAIEKVDIQKVQDVIAKAPGVLLENQNSRNNALKRAQTLTGLIKAHGMSDELDKQVAAYVNKAKATLTTLNERRKPFTQMMDTLKKEFTSVETDIKTSFTDLQVHRDSYAAKKMEEQRERERIAARKMAAEKEKIRLRSELETKLRDNYNNYLSRKKNELYDIFENATIEQVENVKVTIYNARPEMNAEDFAKLINPSVPYDSTLVDRAELDIIISEVVDEITKDSIRTDYASKLQAYKRELLDKLPSKIAELEQMAKANAQEQERLKAEAEKRKQAEQDRIRAQQEEDQRRAAEQASAKAAAAMVDATVTSQAELSFDESPKVKESTEIVVKVPAGYALIFQFWFEKEGKSLEADKIERKTIKQMKTFCENWTLKTGEVINSSLVEYKDKFKAK